MTAQLTLLLPWQLIPVGPAVDHGYMRVSEWRVSTCNPAGATEECQPTVLSKDMRCKHWDGPCQCVGNLMYRGGCRGCDWTAKFMRTSEHLAVADALDHSWPSWRNLPVDPGPIPEGSSPSDVKKRAAWIARLVGIGYPEGWIERGGPIRVRRQQGATRPHTVHTGYDNYSITGEVAGCGLVGCDGIQWCERSCTPFRMDDEDDD